MTEQHQTQITDNSISASVTQLAQEFTELLKPKLSKVQVIAVGSYPLNRDKARDIDLEIFGVPKEDILGAIKTLKDRGRLTIDSIGGNAYVLAFCKDQSGRNLQISMPCKLTGIPHRYQNPEGTIVFDPNLSHNDAWLRRDFTINALGYDPLTSEVIDPYGGQDDLENSILRTTRPYFGSDPIEILRAFKIAAERSMIMDGGLIESINHYIDDPHTRRPTNFDADRYAYEMSTIFTGSADPKVVFHLMQQAGVLFKLVPEMLPLLGCDLDSVFREVSTVWGQRTKDDKPEQIIAGCLTPLVDRCLEKLGQQDDESVRALYAQAFANRFSLSEQVKAVAELV